jgi:energy-coupling factor transporter transmembrane protein EcfT
VNWVFIIVVLLLLAYGLKGRKDGFIKTIFFMFSVIVALIITMVINPYVSKELQNNEKISGYISNKIAVVLDIDQDKNKDDITNQKNTIDQLVLPKSIKNSLKENNNSEVYKALIVDNFGEYVSGYLAVIVINAASFFLIYLIIRIALFIICRALNLFSKLPIINGMNKTAGLLVGVLRGLIAIWILCIILTIFSGTNAGKIIYAYINDSVFLSSIYNNNLLFLVIKDIAKVLF